MNLYVNLKTPVFIYIIEYSDIKKFYVGSTVNFKQRTSEHKYKNKKSHPNRKIKITILFETIFRYRYKWESYYFDLLRNNKIPLVNKANIYDITYTGKKLNFKKKKYDFN